MNLYFVVTAPNEWRHVVLAENKEKAEHIYRIKTRKEPVINQTKRVQPGHYIVGMTYLIDDIS